MSAVAVVDTVQLWRAAACAGCQRGRAATLLAAVIARGRVGGGRVARKNHELECQHDGSLDRGDLRTEGLHEARQDVEARIRFKRGGGGGGGGELGVALFELLGLKAFYSVSTRVAHAAGARRERADVARHQ